MEPCPYRQGEDTATARAAGNYPPQPRRSPALVGRGSSDPDGYAAGPRKPQWSPALIGRERAVQHVASVDPRAAAMEPCPYRQGETVTGWRGAGAGIVRRNGALPLS